MTAVLDQVKNVAYTGVGVNLVSPTPSSAVRFRLPRPSPSMPPPAPRALSPHRSSWSHRTSGRQGRRAPAGAGRRRRRDRSQGRLGLPRHRCTEGHRPEGRQKAAKKA